MRVGCGKFIVQGSEKGVGQVPLGKTRLVWLRKSKFVVQGSEKGFGQVPLGKTRLVSFKESSGY